MLLNSYVIQEIGFEHSVQICIPNLKIVVTRSLWKKVEKPVRPLMAKYEFTSLIYAFLF